MLPPRGKDTRKELQFVLDLFGARNKDISLLCIAHMRIYSIFIWQRDVERL